MNIYEVTGGKAAVATLVGQRTDPQTARFIDWFRSQPQFPSLAVTPSFARSIAATSGSAGRRHRVVGGG
jgi:hypothetical protein